MDDVQISAEDQERIDAMVETYRRSVVALYRMAYLQGQFDGVAKVGVSLRISDLQDAVRD